MEKAELEFPGSNLGKGEVPKWKPSVPDMVALTLMLLCWYSAWKDRDGFSLVHFM